MDNDKAPYYAAPNVNLKGYIYNPRGTVTVTSANGDVYNKGTIYAGSVNMTASNGDFIQTYDASSAKTKSSISSVGGNPLDDTGGLYNVDQDGKANDKIGSGILANGNVFISARYVNINSKIQSGVPDHAITIPKEYKLFYMDGSTKVDVTDAATVPSGAKILVADMAGKEIEGVSYDRTNDRFVISDVEVHGGHVSIVGTILNTTNDTNKARIEALDGYGTIQVKNDSDKNIELKTLSTGGGLEGKIEITDLDRSSGKVTKKTTYTRKDGVIQQSVQHYAADGKASGDPAISTFANAQDAKYQTTKGSYYTVQTGQDSSTTTTYELHDTRVDWWGIDDKAPTSAEMLANGGTVTDFWQGDVRTLEGGAFVSDYNKVDGTKVDGTYVTTDKQFTAAEPVSTFTKKEERLWYTLGIAKKYDYKLVETTYDTKVTQYSLKSDYDVGIGFGGVENGGTLTVDGGSRDVLINGTLSNGRGASTLSGGSLTQGDLGYVDTGSLYMTATGSAGSAERAIKTSADTVSGSAGGDFAVNVKGNVTLGDVSAGKIAAITAEDGITQAAGAQLSASRVNLDAGSGDISGASGALSIRTKQGSGEAYGLKASADGNISITNTGGDLYLDSVTSKHGDVTLTTDGSFIDNNFTDVANENAKAKLDAWSKARVLEGSDATISKQKSLLIAKVQGKYNEYKSLAGYVKDGKYTLDDTAKEALAKNGVTDIDAYIAEKQARYDELKGSVGTWTKDGVETYVKGITDSTDKTLYGNASLTTENLTSDAYLTKDEKAEVLVGSAKSAQDLLVTFSGGSIKEGITDTQTTQKETAHVTGQNVTLTAKGGKTGENARGIGHKENGQQIDLSTKEKIESLTADQLIALASAERGDFHVHVDDKTKTVTVTVSSIRSIEANADGKLIAKAENGAVYLTSDTGVKEGSELLSGGELRMKATGDLKNVTVGAKDQIVLESGEGEISGVTIQNGGTLTARAKKGVSLAKDGDLVINTVYASDGDVALDLKGHSLLAEDGHDTDEETGTTYTNVEGNHISIENVVNVKGEGEGQSLGMKVTGTETPGSIRFSAKGDADITLFGEAASDATSIEAGNTAITNHGKISKGSYKARKALHVYNANDSTITGGTFTGAETTLTNQAELSGAKVEGTTTLTVKNTASIQNATLAGGAATVDNHGENSVMKDVTLTGSTLTLTNEGNVENGSYTAETGAMTVMNSGKLIAGAYTAKAGTMGITNQGTIENGTYTAETGAMTVMNSGKLSAGAYTAKAGTMGITNQGTIENGSYTAGGALTYDGNADSTVTETTMTGASVGITNAGTLTNDTYTAETGAMTVMNRGKLSAGAYTAKAGTMGITNRKTIENAAFTAGGALTYDGNADSTVTETTMTGASVDITNAGTLTNDTYTAETGAMTVTNSGKLSAGKYIAKAGTMGITNRKTIENAAFTAGGALTYDGNADSTVTETTMTGASVDITNAGTLTNGSYIAEMGAMTVTNSGKLSAGKYTAKAGTMGITNQGTIENGEYTSRGDLTYTDTAEASLEDGTLISEEGKAMVNAHGVLQIKKLSAKDSATVEADHDVTLTKAEAGTLAIKSGGSVNAGTLTATTGDAKVKAKTDATIGTLIAEAGGATIEATDGALGVTTLHAKSLTAKAGTTLSAKTLDVQEHAELTSGGDMVLTEAHANTLTVNAGGKLDMTKKLSTAGKAELTSGNAMDIADANVGSVTANAGTTLHAAKLISNGEATLTSKDEATLDEVTAGTLAAESTAGSVNAGTLTATTGDAKVKAKTDATIGTLKAEAGNAMIEATDGALDVTTLNAKEHAALTSGDAMTLESANAKSLTAKAGTTLSATTLGVTGETHLTSGGAMEVTDANVGSVTAKAGTTLHVKKLTSTGEATLTSKDEAKLDEVTAGTLIAESTAGSVNAGTLTATTSDAKVKAKTDAMIGTLKAEAGSATMEATEGKLDVTTLNAKEHAALTSGGAMEVTDANVGSVAAKAGTTLHVKKLTSTGEATLTSKDEAKLDDVTAGTLAAESTAGSVKAGTLTATTGDAEVKAKTDVTIGTLNAKEHAVLTSGGAMEVTEATVGTLAAESTAGSVKAETLTAKAGDASVTAKKDVTIGTLKAEAGNATIEATDGALGVTTLNAKNLTANAGTTLSAKTLDVKEHAELTSGSAMTLESANADTLTAKAGTTLDVTKLHTAGDAGLASGSDSDMVLHAAEAGGKLTASAGGSISVKGTDAKISGSAIEMIAKKDIRITDRSLVGKLDGVDVNTPAGTTTGSGAAGSLVTGEAKPHDFDVSQKGSALLSSAGGKVTLSAKKVEIDTLANGEGNAADLKISADNIGIDDLAGVGAQHVTILGADGQSQAHYAGIHSTAAGGALVKDSAVEHLNLTGKEPLGITSTAIGGDSVLATDKIRVTIQKNPGSSQAEHFGNLSLNGYDIATDHVMTSVKDGLTVNGERFPMTAEGVMNASLYEDRTLGRDGREKEEETEKDSPSLAFGAPNDQEAYEVVK